MSIAPLAGAGLQPVTIPNKVEEYTASGTVLRWSLVYRDTAPGTICVARADAGTQRPLGVALNYAATGGKVLVCIDPDQVYRATITAVPMAVSLTFGNATNYFATVGNLTPNAGSVHNSAAKINPTGAALSGRYCIQLLRPSPIVGNLYGDGTGIADVDCTVDCRLTQLITASDEV